MNDEKLWNICIEIYTQMYKEAEPNADFNVLMYNGKTVKPNWFMKYYLSQERQEEIITEVMKKYKLNKLDKKKISKEIWLGGSPNSCRETWKEGSERMKNDLNDIKKIKRLKGMLEK